jgi:hypothetical protein
MSKRKTLGSVQALLGLMMLGAFATSAVAQSSEPRWLECTETQSTRPGSYSFGVYGIRPGSLIRYDRAGPQRDRLERWGDYCSEREATCHMDDDEIVASYRNLRSAMEQTFEEIRLRIDRRTGEARYMRTGGRIQNWATGQCRRVEDPRPPAAF